eukprot:1155758-Rhodomonas_salina.1
MHFIEVTTEYTAMVQKFYSTFPELNWAASGIAGLSSSTAPNTSSTVENGSGEPDGDDVSVREGLDEDRGFYTEGDGRAAAKKARKESRAVNSALKAMGLTREE